MPPADWTETLWGTRKEVTVASGAVEHAVKLSMDLRTDLPDLREVVAASVRQPEERLQAVYFDTSDAGCGTEASPSGTAPAKELRDGP